MDHISKNNLFLNAFNFSAIAMAIVSMDGRWLKVNSSLCQLLGYSIAEFEQMKFQIVAHPEDVIVDQKNLNKMINGEIQHHQMVKRYFHKNRSIVWGLSSVSLVKDDQNKPLYFILQIQDITEQKELQEKLKKSENRYRNLIQYSPEPMAIHSEGRLVYVNEACVKIIGARSYKDLVGKKTMDFIHPDYRELAFRRNKQSIRANQQLKPYDIKLISINGKEIDVRISSVPIEYEGKKSFQAFFSDITQRKKMEEAIRKNEAQYKSLIEQNPDAVIGIDLEGNFTLVNESCTRITGYSKEELLRMSFYPLFFGKDLEKATDTFNNVIQGDTETIDLALHKKDGAKLVVNITSIPIIIDGLITGIYAIAKDITEQRRMGMELKQSEVRYRALVESSPNAVVVHQEGKIVYTNPKFPSLLKAASDGDIIGHHIIKFIHPDYHEFVKERINLLERNIPVESLEEKWVTIDGSIIDVEVTATPIEFTGKPAFQVIIQDISKRKEMEQKLYKSQKQYRSVIENVQEVIFQTNKEGNFTFLNPAWEKISGFTIDESMGKYFLDYVYGKDCERYNKQFQSLIQGKQEYFHEEVRYVTRKGDYCWVEVFTRVSLNVTGEIIGTLGTLNDFTNRKESEEELKASEERFRLLAEYSSDLITMHDVNRKYIYVSPACKEILQYDEEELVGTDASLLVHPEDQDMVTEQFQTLFTTGYVVITHRIRRKDGEYIWLESACKLFDEIHSGKQLLIAVSRNINDRKWAEQKLQEANEILQHLSTIDGLTGVSNRRAFDERLEMEWNHSLRNSNPLSLIMLDIDYFKEYNDTYGHQSGDECLKHIALVVRDTLKRSTDLLCRYGGEEFCVILPDTDELGAKTVGEKIRLAIESLKIPHAGSANAPWITISVGTATMIPSVFSSSRDLISNADKALYKAKNDGRNCVQSYK